MKKIVFLFFISLLLFSCGSRHNIHRPEEKLRVLTSHYEGKNSYTVKSLLADAETYLGTPYQFGGNSKQGLDCSALVLNVYREQRIKLPRRSQDQALQGKKIDITESRPGDLLFFDTVGNGGVTHVGIVKEILDKGEVTFIHASTSKGVIISSLNERYWNKAFLFARRVL